MNLKEVPLFANTELHYDRVQFRKLYVEEDKTGIKYTPPGAFGVLITVETDDKQQQIYLYEDSIESLIQIYIEHQRKFGGTYEFTTQY